MYQNWYTIATGKIDHRINDIASAGAGTVLKKITGEPLTTMSDRPTAKELKKFANFRGWRETEGSISVQEGPPTKTAKRISVFTAAAPTALGLHSCARSHQLGDRQGSRSPGT